MQWCKRERVRGVLAEAGGHLDLVKPRLFVGYCQGEALVHESQVSGPALTLSV